MINLNNPSYKNFYDFIRKEFNNVRKKTSITLFEHFLIKSETINLTQVKNIPKSFIEKNKSRNPIPDNVIKIFKYHIEKYREAEVSLYQMDAPSNDKYINASLSQEEDEEDGIIPTELYSYTDMLENLAIDKNINHIFNKNLINSPINYNANTIQRSIFKFTFTGEVFRLPITYKVKCPQCSNIAIFTENDLALDIYCTHNRPDNHQIPNTHRHKLKTSNMNVKDTKSVYIYTVQNGRDNLPILAYSFDLLPDNMVEVQYIFVTRNSKNTIIILSSNVDHSLRTNKILLPTKKGFFLEDIFESVKIYMEKEHNIIFNNNNRIVSYIVILTLLIQKFHHWKFYSLILGYSGSGKSFVVKILSQLFSGQTSFVDGGTVTKNIMMGGNSARKNIDGSSMIVKGVVGTQDLVFCDEASNQLNEFLKFPRSDNLFSMLKTVSGDKVPITTQGTYEYDSIASALLAGNVEQLASREFYLIKVTKKYKQLAKKNLDPNIPLYKPISYYLRYIKDEKLARAHYEVRMFDPELNKKHFITMLPPAEMARFTFFLLVEDNDDKKSHPVDIGSRNFIKPIHREQIYLELFERLDNFDMNTVKYKDFFIEVRDYIFDKFLKKETQNFYGKDINNHMKENILNLAKSFFLFQKQYYSEELVLTTRDKKYFEDFMAYNYNTLSTQEARLDKFPYYDNYLDFNKSTEINKIAEREEEIKETYGEEVKPENLPDDVFNMQADMEDL